MAPTWLIDLPTCASTNTWAMDHADALAHGACIHTAHQTAGRGQPGNTWRSPPGVLTASVVLTMPATIPLSQLALVAGLAVAHTAEDCAPGLRVHLKWPNDCLVDGRKLAGILCERAPGTGRQAVIGVGLNLDPQWNQTPEALPLAADRRWAPASLAEAVSPTPEALAVLGALRQYLIEAAGLLANGGWPRLLPELNARDWLGGRAIRCETSSGTMSGHGAGIDGDGCLLLRTVTGTQAIASARAVTVLPTTAVS